MTIWFFGFNTSRLNICNNELAMSLLIKVPGNLYGHQYWEICYYRETQGMIPIHVY